MVASSAGGTPHIVTTRVRAVPAGNERPVAAITTLLVVVAVSMLITASRQ
jgi:hypothetical protein